MPKLILRFDDRVLKEYPVGAEPVLVGRLPSNGVVIDNPAVSNPHARLFRDGDTFVIEDLQSRNGTFVNEKRVSRHTLRHLDEVLIGKHTLIFDQLSADQPEAAGEPAPKTADRGATVLLDTRHYRELLAKGQNAPAPPPAGSAAPIAASPAAAAGGAPPMAVLRVLAGSAAQTEYELVSHTSLIGKGDTALIRLKGWFKPRVAAAIARKSDGYAVTPLAGKTLLNGTRLAVRHDLEDGDVLQVSGLTLEFRSPRRE